MAERDNGASARARPRQDAPYAARVADGSVVEGLVRELYARLWEAGDRAAPDGILHPELVFRGSVGMERRGINGFWDYLSLVRTALDDYRCDILSLIADGPHAAAKMYFHGVHRGKFLGIAPSGRHIGWHGAAFFEVRDGLLADIWVLGDVDGLRAAMK
ncbi:MAG: ester cyclase, partial [Pseudomonadota bacterium]